MGGPEFILSVVATLAWPATIVFVVWFLHRTFSSNGKSH